MHAPRPILLTAALLTALGLLAAGCGARLSPEQQRLALDRAAGTGAGAGQGAAAPGDAGVLPGEAAVGGASAAPGAASAPAAGGPAQGGAGAGAGGGNQPGKPAACKPGGNSDTGVTASTITIVNSSDISGPIPGLFESAQQATKAFVAYRNATFGGVCGRQIKLINLDSRTSDTGDREAALQACRSAFAMVGSMSAFDSGGAKPVNDCGIPDIRSGTVNPPRQSSPVTYGTQSVQAHLIPTAQPDYYRQRFPQAVKKAAFLYINAGAAKVNAEHFIKGYTKRGFNFVYTQGIDVSDYNYSPYVQKMKDLGVRYVQFIGAYQQSAKIAKAMQGQGFKPDAYVLDPTAYNAEYIRQAGAAGEGTQIFLNTAMLEENNSAELRLYNSWLQRVSPGTKPSFFGMFAWGAARIFAEQTEKLGANPTRKGLLAGVKAVNGYTSNGLFSRQDVGYKKTGPCWSFIELRGGKWVRRAPGSGYTCGSLVDSGIRG